MILVNGDLHKLVPVCPRPPVEDGLPRPSLRCFWTWLDTMMGADWCWEMAPAMFGVPHLFGTRLWHQSTGVGIRFRGMNQCSYMQAWYAQKVPQLVKMSARSLSVRNVSMISLGASRTLRWRWWRLCFMIFECAPFSIGDVPSGNNSHSELENGPLKTWIYPLKMVDLSIVFWGCLPGRVKIVKQRKSRDWTSFSFLLVEPPVFFASLRWWTKNWHVRGWLNE